jgi:hypothetical protein
MIPKYQLTQLPRGLAQALGDYLDITGVDRITRLAKALDYVQRRRVVTLWGGTELPSLDEAISGQLAPQLVPRIRIGAGGASATIESWSRELVESGEAALLSLFRNRPTLVGRALWPALVGLSARVPDALLDGEVSAAARHIGSFLLMEGPMSTSDLKQRLPQRLPLLPTSVVKGLAELESKLIIYPQIAVDCRGKPVTKWELLRRGLARPEHDTASRTAAVASFLEATVCAAGVVDLCESGRWFRDFNAESQAAISVLIESGKLCRVGEQNASIVAWRELAEKVPSAA